MFVLYVLYVRSMKQAKDKNELAQLKGEDPLPLVRNIFFKKEEFFDFYIFIYLERHSN